MILQKFCSRIIGALAGKVFSLNVVGSAVSSDYLSGVSDINLLIILDGLDLEDIRPLVPDVKKFWLGKRISPRLISRRNLDEAIRYFPVDFWNMQRQHTVLYGQDMPSEIVIRRRIYSGNSVTSFWGSACA